MRSAGSPISIRAARRSLTSSPVYGSETGLWMRRRRWFFLAMAGLFGYADGSEWGVSHYRMRAGQKVRQCRLDPAIHLLRKTLAKIDGCAGQARA
jgi:hypothetical protein